MNVRPKILYPSLIVAAVSVTLLSMTGIAAITGHLPGAIANTNANPLAANAATSNQSSPFMLSGRSEQKSSKLAAANTPVAENTCKGCGTVESVRLVERKGSGSGLGAVAGGVAGAVIGNQIGAGNGRTVMTIAGGAGGAYLGNEIEKNTKKTTAYQIRVRMADGSTRIVNQHEAPNVNSGDRVRLSNGAITEVL